MMSTTTRRRTLAGLGAWALLTGLATVGCMKAPVSFNVVDITGADYAKKLNMTDADGKPRSLDEFKGKVVVVFFGYTQCPDVCPTTLAELAAVKKKLGDDGSKVVGVFVSVDPERDTPEVIKAYVNSFGADFVALRGSVDETKAVARDFKVFFAKVPGKVEGSYTMDHTAGSYVFDTQGRIRLFERYGTAPDALASDLKALIGGA
jgi:protein SCO1/2